MSDTSKFVEYTTSDVDFYEMLGITFEGFAESTLRSAYRKTSIKYHPDKLKENFDPAKYELFMAAYEVLKDPVLKTKYDNYRSAKLQKQRANELFEGKRRQMKEDLEARERGQGVKRPRDEEREREMARMAEEGRKRKAARMSMMAENGMAQPVSSPAPRSPVRMPTAQPPPSAQKVEDESEDEVVRLERIIAEKKARRKAEKKSRKSGIFEPLVMTDQETSTPIKRPDIFKGLKADDKSSASPKFSFSPNNTPKTNTPKTNDFAATMARLKAAERQRLEDELRHQEAAETSQ